jgi:hypothetical protein
MRTSFHHQSEAQPPNGPLTAATSPDLPPQPASPVSVGHVRAAKISARFPRLFDLNGEANRGRGRVERSSPVTLGSCDTHRRRPEVVLFDL